MIDAGYQRPTDGVYPTQPVHFGLIPKPGKMFKDFLAIEAGADQTGQNLGALNPLQAAAPNLGNALAKQGDVVTPDAPPPGPKPPVTEHPWPTFQLPVTHPALRRKPARSSWRRQSKRSRLPPVEEVPTPPAADKLIIDRQKVEQRRTARSTVDRLPLVGAGCRPEEYRRGDQHCDQEHGEGRFTPKPATTPATYHELVPKSTDLLGRPAGLILAAHVRARQRPT